MTGVAFCESKYGLLIRIVDFERRDLVGFQLNLSAHEAPSMGRARPLDMGHALAEPNHHLCSLAGTFRTLGGRSQSVSVPTRSQCLDSRLNRHPISTSRRAKDTPTNYQHCERRHGETRLHQERRTWDGCCMESYKSVLVFVSLADRFGSTLGSAYVSSSFGAWDSIANTLMNGLCTRRNHRNAAGTRRKVVHERWISLSAVRATNSHRQLGLHRIVTHRIILSSSSWFVIRTHVACLQCTTE